MTGLDLVALTGRFRKAVAPSLAVSLRHQKDRSKRVPFNDATLAADGFVDHIFLRDEEESKYCLRPGDVVVVT